MNKFSKMMGVTALSMSLTVPALAEVSAPVNNNQQVQNELAYAFGDNNNLQAKAITTQEMKDTQGAILPIVAGVLMGGAISAWTNHGISYATTGHLASTKSTVMATGAGMVGGAYSGVMLKGAGLAPSVFNSAAWKGANGVANATIRTNGYFIGQSTSGVWGKHK